MAIEIEAVWEDGVLKLERPLFLEEGARLHVTIRSASSRVAKSAGLIPWKGELKDLEYLIESADNDPLEGS